MTARNLAAALTAGLLAACGDGGPSGSSPTSTTTTAPASVTLTVVSGETGAPVAGATVVVNAVTLTTDGNGNVSASALSVGATIDVIAGNYFERQTLYRGPASARLVLWPMTSPTGLTPEITQRIVYTSYEDDAILGELPLYRAPLGERIQVFVEPSIAGDARVTRVVDQAVAAIRSALQGRVDFVVTATPPASGVVWRITINPEITTSEFISTTTRTYDGYEIVGAEIAFRSLPELYEDSRALMYTLGIAYGLHNSGDSNDRMFVEWWRRRPNDFSPKEGLIMRLMLERPGGNRWPDNDRGLGTSTLRPASVWGLKASSS